MALRTTLEKHKAWVVPGLLVVATIAILASGWRTHSANALPGPITKVYYTVDGKTYFADDVNKPFPFDHDGKKAWKAYVFRGGDGKPFVGLIGRQVGQAALIEVQKPGDAKWVQLNSPEGQRLLAAVSPIGDRDAILPD